MNAFTRQGYSDKEAAAAIQTPYKVYQKAMNTNPNYDAYNPILKRLKHAPADVVREFFALGGAKLGLSYGIDQAQVQASIALAAAIRNVLREGSR